MGFTKSKYQQAIADTYVDTNYNMLIGAVAGSGKTTTLLQLLEETYDPAIFLAFNKSIADEIGEKTKSHPTVETMTLHSMGMKALMRHFSRRLDVKANKPWELAKKFVKEWKLGKKEYVPTMMRLIKLVDMYRLTLCTDKQSLKQIADEMGLDYKVGDLNKALQLVEEYERYNKNPKIIDFTDMIYIPATNPSISLTVRPSVVFVDECQDLNACQHALVDKLIKANNARFVACGDPYQSIYGFAGAHSKSFDLFKEKDNVKEMPLSICYRCPTEVIDEANEVYDIMEPFESACEGIVREGTIKDAEEGDMVICRNLKPLVPIYFDLLKRSIKVIIRGKDLGQGLISLLKPYAHLPLYTTQQQLNRMLIEKVDELKEAQIAKPLSHPSYAALEEKVQVIKIVGEKFQSTGQVIAFLEQMFADDNREGVILSTIHKAKGLEADRVFLLDRKLIPSKFTQTKDQLIQERNLLYVAITRAKRELIYIGDIGEKDDFLRKLIPKEKKMQII